MTTYILIAALVLTLVAAVVFILNRLKIAGVSEAIVVSGSRSNGEVKVVQPGGKTFVIPVIQKASTVSLLQRKIELTVEGVDLNKIPIRVRAVAMIKIGSTPALIRAAAERFSHQDASIDANAQEVLLGTLRAILSQMTVDSLVTDRAGLALKVTENANTELEVIGLVLDSLQVSEIADDGDYIRNLGIPEAQRVQRDARIAKANADREANDAEVDARQKIAEKNRQLAVRQSQLQAETDQAQAIAAAAGPLAKAEQDQAIATREQGTAEQMAILRERQLDTEIKKPADARLYETIKNAEADKARQINDAQAEAEAIKLKGEADKARVIAAAEAEAQSITLRGNADKARLVAAAEAESSAISLRGTAEATATAQRGTAEAEALSLRAEALKQLNEAGITEMVINKLPEIARELASPMSNIKDLSIISTDGASALPKAVANNFGQLDTLVKSFTGVGISDMLSTKMAEVADGEEPENVVVHKSVSTKPAVKGTVVPDSQ